jgi:hypothetical protein
MIFADRMQFASGFPECGFAVEVRRYSFWRIAATIDIRPCPMS